MAFRKPLRRIPESVKKKRRQAEVDRDFDFQENVVGPLFSLDEEGEAALREAEEAMKNCICPKKGCPVHPD